MLTTSCNTGQEVILKLLKYFAYLTNDTVNTQLVSAKVTGGDLGGGGNRAVLGKHLLHREAQHTLRVGLGLDGSVGVALVGTSDLKRSSGLLRSKVEHTGKLAVGAGEVAKGEGVLGEFVGDTQASEDVFAHRVGAAHIELGEIHLVTKGKSGRSTTCEGTLAGEDRGIDSGELSNVEFDIGSGELVLVHNSKVTLVLIVTLELELATRENSSKRGLNNNASVALHLKLIKSESTLVGPLGGHLATERALGTAVEFGGLGKSHTLRGLDLNLQSVLEIIVLVQDVEGNLVEILKKRERHIYF
jgi:hypothetical protein